MFRQGHTLALMGRREAGLGRLFGEGQGRHADRRAGRHRVVPPVAVTAAGLSLFFHVIHFSARGHFAVLADDATASQCGEAEKSNKAHHTENLESNTCARSEISDALALLKISASNRAVVTLTRGRLSSRVRLIG